MTLSDLIVSKTHQGILFVSDAGVISFANQALCDISGYQVKELLGAGIELFLQRDFHALHRQSRQFYLKSPQPRPMGASGPVTLLHKDGHKVPVDIVLRRVDEEGLKGVIAFVSDTSEFQKTLRELQYQATHDELTGLSNRWFFTACLKQALAQAHRLGKPVAVLLLDLDGFKTVNDSFGHAIGDKLLVSVGRCLTSQVRASDVVGRLGGDEFVVLLRDVADVADAFLVADKIVAAVSDPLVIEGLAIKTACSVGISMYPTDAQDPESLLRCADLAMYHSKATGRGRSSAFFSGLADSGSTSVGASR